MELHEAGSGDKEYRFVSNKKIQNACERLRKIKSERLDGSLRRLIKAGTAVERYNESRVSFCAINIIFNERGYISPAFRDFRKLRSHTGLTDDQEVLASDRQVIDLHWLYCQHRDKVMPSEDEFRPIFTGVDFDFQLASRYAKKKWRADTRATISLKLPEKIQKELAVYRSEKTRKRLAQIQKTKSTVEQKIRQRASEASSRLSLDRVEEYLRSYHCLALADGSPSDAVYFLERMTGSSVPSEKLKSARVAMANRKKWFLGIGVKL